MRSGLGQPQERALTRSAPEAMVPPALLPVTKEIPYDYVAKFLLEGTRGRRQQDVINISIDGAFIATAIGYGLIPKLPTLEPKQIQVSAGTIQLALPPGPTNLAEVIANFVAARIVESSGADPVHTRNHLANGIVHCLLMRFCGIDFKYSIVDSGTGRELQNQPIHNIAGLGSADGDRPFRPFPKPMMFLPRSTIRIEIEEISEGPLYAGAELQIVLQGYKMLGYGTALP